MRIFFGKNECFILAVILFLSTCALNPAKKDEEIHPEPEKKGAAVDESSSKQEKLDEYLVDLNKYTTRGGVYHKKFQKQLLGIAEEIIEKKKFKIIKGSIGFYFEKKSKQKERLYLGIDFDTGMSNEVEYAGVAMKLLKKNISEIIFTTKSFRMIFDEKEIVGMVIGFKWTTQDKKEQVNIWINQSDVIRMEKNVLTYDELIQKSTITDTAGNIIMFQQ